MENENIHDSLDILEKIVNPISKDPEKFSVAVILRNKGKRNWIFRNLIDIKKFDSMQSKCPEKIGDLLAMAITDNIDVFSNCPIRKFNNIFADLDIFAFIGLLLLNKRCIYESIRIAGIVISNLNEDGRAAINMEFYKKDFEDDPDLCSFLENMTQN